MEIIDVEQLARRVEGNSRRQFKPEELNPTLAPQFDNSLGSFRMLVSGKSGAGKTNLIVSAIISNQMRFDHLYLYVRDPSQSKYQLLMLFISQLEQEWERERGERRQFATVITDPTRFVPLDEIDSNLINLVIFDDMLTEKHQKTIEEYFIRGRHRGVNCIYLTQDYHKTSPTIRKQCQYFAIFGVSSKAELVQLSKDHSLEYDYKEFKQILNNATQPAPNFLLIDRRTDIPLLQLRKNWDQVLNEKLENRSAN